MQCFQLNKKLAEDYPETAEVSVEVRSRLTTFSEHLPIIKCITSDAITDEDWDLIKLKIGRDDLERETITVNGFAEFKLHDYLEDIDDITSSAEKKY